MIQPDARKGGTSGCVLNFGDPAWSDYDAQLEWKVEKGGEFGVCFRAREGNQLFTAFGGFNNTSHAVLIQRYKVQSYGLAVPGVKGRIEPGKWYRVRIEARGSRFKVFLEDKQLFDFQLKGFDRGGVGLRTSQSSARFRNIKVTDPRGQVLFEGLPRKVFVLGSPPPWEDVMMNRVFQPEIEAAFARATPKQGTN